MQPSITCRDLKRSSGVYANRRRLPHPVAAKQPTVLRLKYRPDIDGLRAVAVVSVIGSHTGYLLGGGAGVDIFFVISGFLISGIIFDALSQKRFSLSEFYIRRIKRIFPALIVVLFITWGLGWLLLLPDEFQGLGKDIASSSAFIHDFGVYGWVPRLAVPQYNFNRELLGPIWSLGVEEQFYLLWPLLLLAMWKLPKGPLTLTVLITILSFALGISVYSSDPAAVYFLPWNRLWELSLGSLLACIQLARVDMPGSGDADLISSKVSILARHHAIGLAGTVLLLTSITGLNHPGLFPEWRALAPSAGAVCIISAGPQWWINRHVLSARPMVFVGLISYPLYLWHDPILWIGHILESRWTLTPSATAGAVAASFIAAFLTYKYVELPIRYSSGMKPMAYGLCMLMAVCGALGYLTYARIIPPRSEPSDVARVVKSVGEDRLTNDNRTTWIAGTDQSASIGQGPHRVLFVGDGSMQQYYPRISELLSRQPFAKRSAVFAVREWCAPAAIEMMVNEFPKSFRSACQATLQKVAEYANDPNVDTVVIAAYWYFYFFKYPDSVDHYGEANTLKPGADRAFDSLTQTIRRFVEAGKRVYIVSDTPIVAAFDPHMLVRRSVLPPGFSLNATFRLRAGIEQALRPIKSKLVKIAQDTGATVIDPMDSLCDATSCPAISPGGEVMYHDMFHLNPSYVRVAASVIDVTLTERSK